MDQRASLITLAAEDVAASQAFYERLGWKAGFSNEEVVFFQANGFVIGLYDRAAFAREVGAQDFAPGGFALAYNVRGRDEVDEVLEEVRGAGAKIVKEAVDRPWGGRSGYFTDPDGHLWEVAWNPAWSIGEDGATRMD